MDFSMLGQDQPGQPPLLRGTMPLENYRQEILLVIPSLMYGFATLFVFMRFWSRHVKGVGAQLDDHLCLAALILGYAQHSTLLTMILGGGLGLDFDRIHISAMNVLFKSTMANLVLYFANVAVLQFSILALYTRIFGVNQKFRWMCWAGMGLVTVWGVAAVLTRIFPCGKNIDASVFMFGIASPEKCVNTDPICKGMGLSHVLLDFLLIGLPIPIIWKLNTALTNKIIITTVMIVGFGATIFAILRMRCIVQLLDIGPENATVALWQGVLFQSLEVPVGICCICVPTLAPFWAQVSESRFGSWAKRLVSTATGSRFGSTGKSTGNSTQQTYQSGRSNVIDQGRGEFGAPRRGSGGRSVDDSSIDEEKSLSDETRAQNGQNGISVQHQYQVEWTGRKA